MAITKPIDGIKTYWSKIESQEHFKEKYEVTWYQSVGFQISDEIYKLLIKARYILSTTKDEQAKGYRNNLEWLRQEYGMEKKGNHYVANCKKLEGIIDHLVRESTDNKVKTAMAILQGNIPMDIYKTKNLESMSIKSPYNSMLYDHQRYGDGYYDYIQPENDLSFYNEMLIVMIATFIGIGFICVLISIICIVCAGLIWKSRKKIKSTVDETISNCL